MTNVCLFNCTWISGIGYNPITSSTCMVDINNVTNYYNGNFLEGYWMKDTLSLTSF